MAGSPTASSNRTETPAAAGSSDGVAIAVRRLVKSYSGRRAVDDLSFDVIAGECFALLGPNGAGKTTTIEILEGYRAPDAGTVRVLGLDPQRQGPQLKRRIGLMLQESGIYPAIQVGEALRLFASYYPNPADPLALLRLVGLEDAARTRYRQLSGGQKQRLSLALALVGRPELVFLDEPTTGMDPQARLATWEIVRSLKQTGVTVVLTTHFMDEAERLADRVALAVMSTGMVSLGIATAYERYYRVLKRLGGTPLSRGQLLTAKMISVLVIEVVQIALLGAIGTLAYGGRPAGGAWSALAALVLGNVAFCGLGLLMAGTLRAEATLAGANGLYLVLLLFGGIVLPLEQLPTGLAGPASVLPAAALSNSLRGAFATGSQAPLESLAVLAAWAAVTAMAAGRTFQWE